MDSNSLPEEIVVKTRKPYTITKQREKWTDAEHIKFLDAVKLYGRAWQRIAEHVGTKTAVQIRSHAQKFFTKLEKEANMKGIPFGQAHDFEIPPPRPKRKPNSPYPRKNSASSLSPFVEALDGKTSKSPSTLFHENNAAWKIQGMKDNYEDGNSSKLLNLFQDAPSSSFNGFCPLKLHLKDTNAIQGSFTSFDVNKGTKENVSGELKRTCVNSQAVAAQKEEDSRRSDQRYIKNVPTDLTKRSGVGNVPATTVANAIPSTSGSNKTNNQSFPTVLSNFSQFPGNPDDYRSLLNILSGFSRFMMSTLLQNPAFHAAASAAALIDSSASETLHGRIPSSTNPSMAAISAATVSAAAAWWATQGLLPNYPSPNTDFKLAPDDKKEESQGTFQNSLLIDQKTADPEQSEAPRFQLPNLKSLTLSPSSDSDVSGRGEPVDHAKANKFKPLSSNGVHESDKARNKKKPDRSSSGSNTPSSNEAATERVLMKNQDEKESEKVRLTNPPIAEKNTRRTRSSAIINESWKEVSEEGRLAFQALFTKEIMPQSFAPPHAKELEAMTEEKGKEAISEIPAVDLHAKASTSETTSLYYLQGFCVASGFKPYKRCSDESKEKIAPGSDDGRKKKIRLEGEISA